MSTTIPSLLAEPRKVAVVGAPVAFGQGLDGVDDGPGILRDQGLQGRVTDLGWRFEDLGDVKVGVPSASDPDLPGNGRAKHAYAVGRTCMELAGRVAGAASEGSFVLTLGGDHSLAAGSVAGVLKARPDTGIVWVDAHADINTPVTSSSGNVHGMPVAFLMKLADTTSVPGYEWLVSEDSDVPKLDPSRIVYIGLRDVDRGERSMLRDLGIKAFDMHAVDRTGIAKVVEASLDHLRSAGATNLHLSFDIDACDPSIAPSTGTTVRGGLNYREAHFLCEELALTGGLASMDMVEVNPKLGRSEEDADATAATAVELICSALGKSVLG